MKSPQQVLIAGYYGFGNAGDEAILAAMLGDLRALKPGSGPRRSFRRPNLHGIHPPGSLGPMD